MKVLLITPNFFDYPKQICDEIRSMGHEVDWFDDRPSTNSLVKATVRIKKELINFMINKYFEDIINSIQGKRYDKVLLISGQSLSFNEEMIKRLKIFQSQAEFILYQWDSQKNFPYIEHLQKYFDRCYSFDKEDVSGSDRLRFLPLFFGRRYEEIGKKNNTEIVYDFMFVGTAHPKKYKYVKEMSEQLSAVYKRQYIYFFFPSRLVYFYRKFKNPELRKAHYSEFHFTPVNGEEMDRQLTQSSCVLDSPQQSQIGLTIRVLETLGAKKKVITTNPDVVNYDFYKPENICVYDGKFDYESPFFKEPYEEIDENIYKKYSIQTWLSVLIGEREELKYDR